MNRSRLLLSIMFILIAFNSESKSSDFEKKAVAYYQNRKVIFFHNNRIEINFFEKMVVTENDFINLQYLKNVTVFHMYECQLTDKYIEYLNLLQKLEVIRLEGTNITDKAVQMICQNHPNLEQLHLNRTKITSKALKYISNLKKLEILELADTNIDDEGVIYISQLKKLGVLDLTRTKITDKSVPYLKEFDEMDELYIMKTGITEAGYKQIYDYYKKANRNWIIYREDDM